MFKGVLLDLDGVFFTGRLLLPGAKDTLDKLQHSPLQHRFITNTSTLTQTQIKDKLQGMGLSVQLENIFSAPQAAKAYLQDKQYKNCFMLLDPNLRSEFACFSQGEGRVDAVLMGDIGETWNYKVLNQAFTHLSNGAELIALHKSRCWQTEQGLKMDIGGFVAAMEYAAQVTAVVLGKPSADFFSQTVKDMQLEKDQVLMVGDDIFSDIGGAQQAGIHGVLVRTGKYREKQLHQSGVTPWAVIESIAQLPELLRL